jgi:hypothetical protein
MKAALLDLNVLVALVWPSHVHHENAHRWFAEERHGRWATCPLTQCGLVRISSNPVIIPEAVSCGQAMQLLTAMTGHPDHVFWPDDLDLSQSEVSLPWITGHRQVVDVYLIGLAARNNGELVTLDRRLKNSVSSSRLDRFVSLIATG